MKITKAMHSLGTNLFFSYFYVSLFVFYVTDVDQANSIRVYICRLKQIKDCENEKLSQANHNLAGFN